MDVTDPQNNYRLINQMCQKRKRCRVSVRESRGISLESGRSRVTAVCAPGIRFRNLSEEPQLLTTF